MIIKKTGEYLSEITIKTYQTKSFKHEGVDGGEIPDRIKTSISAIVNETKKNSAVVVPVDKNSAKGVEKIQHKKTKERKALTAISGANGSLEKLPGKGKNAGWVGATAVNSA